MTRCRQNPSCVFWSYVGRSVWRAHLSKEVNKEFTTSSPNTQYEQSMIRSKLPCSWNQKRYSSCISCWEEIYFPQLNSTLFRYPYISGLATISWNFASFIYGAFLIWWNASCICSCLIVSCFSYGIGNHLHPPYTWKCSGSSCSSDDFFRTSTIWAS